MESNIEEDVEIGSLNPEDFALDETTGLALLQAGNIKSFTIF
jgi:hypothetical protein